MITYEVLGPDSETKHEMGSVFGEPDQPHSENLQLLISPSNPSLSPRSGTDPLRELIPKILVDPVSSPVTTPFVRT